MMVPSTILDAASVARDLGSRLAALAIPKTAHRLRAMDAQFWGIPGQSESSVISLEGPDSTACISVRVTSESIILALTPGGAGPCGTCLDTRWRDTRPSMYRLALDDPHGVAYSTPAPVSEPHVAILVSLMDAAADHLAQYGTTVISPVWEISRGSIAIKLHALMRSSSCPDCYVPEADSAEGARIDLKSVPVRKAGDTRAQRPEELELRLDALVNPVCGVIGGTAVRAYKSTATAPTSGFFEVRSKYGLHEMWWSGHAASYGTSEILGALEGLERSAGQRSRRQMAVRAKATELTVPFVEMEECGVYEGDFYLAHAERYVAWREDPSIPWVWGWSLRDNRAVLVPEQLVYYLDYRQDHRNTVQECSNGCASGTSVTEATLHGLLELLERDAFLISWHAGHQPPEIDLDSIQQPFVQQMRAHLDLCGYDLRCFDVRVDLRVPAVGAVAVRRDGGDGALCFAGGASLDPEDAVRAAVCEVASYVPSFADRVAANRDALKLMVEDYNAVTELEDHALLFGLPEMTHFAEHWLGAKKKVPLAECFADWTNDRSPTTDLRESIIEIVDMLGARGMDSVVVDQTTLEQRALGIHTVAVIVPGLVPIDFGWQRQRVLRMPRTLWAHYRAGLRTAPLAPVDLHSIPHPFP